MYPYQGAPLFRDPKAWDCHPEYRDLRYTQVQLTNRYTGVTKFLHRARAFGPIVFWSFFDFRGRSWLAQISIQTQSTGVAFSNFDSDPKWRKRSRFLPLWVGLVFWWTPSETIPTLSSQNRGSIGHLGSEWVLSGLLQKPFRGEAAVWTPISATLGLNRNSGAAPSE